ncbi:LysR family transcriptional regulator [Ligilactobacillus pobuzihii]|uniref:LysR family transcriptional regulator n=1 Tax=Ligilactobacillus pobuzihii TaxID=449659 RepID=UPI0019CFEC74|nr:LysR family transcriptional regulator [Ligilactobacillus pobuzihii]MBN7275387.1 LysR family transcriptional regulator [Ligilactobacillus pobuzihii]
MSKIKILSEILLECQHCTTLTQVAEGLYVSQPYVSQILKEAEQQYQVVLVKRTKIPIHVTPAGRRLLKNLIQLINDKKALSDEMALFAGQQKCQMNITFNQPLATLMLPELYTALETNFPGMSFEFNEQTTYLATQSLLENESKIFVGSALNHRKITTLPITQDEKPLILIPKTNPLYAKVSSQTDLNQNWRLFENSDFIGLSGQSYFQNIVNKLFVDHGVNINVKLNVPNTIAATLTALHSSAMTVTLPFVLPRLQIPKEKYKLITIPTALFNAELGISYGKDAEQMVKNVAEYLQHLIIKFYSK